MRPTDPERRRAGPRAVGTPPSRCPKTWGAPNASPASTGRDFAAGTVAVKSGFRWGKLLVLWASPAGGKPPARQPS
jgi:hypothetical protein